MGQDAHELGRPARQLRRQLEQQGIAGTHPRAMAVAVDLDQRRDAEVRGARVCREEARRRQAVDHHLAIDTASEERRDVIQLVRRETDGVENVGEARRDEKVGLAERRNGDRAGAGQRAVPGDQARDLQTLVRLDVRPEADAQSLDVGAHAAHVRFQDRPVED